ncbi:MAG: hypothetical protein CL843_19570 [Crocinitomicaceae bacterium]|nr:hypothetical protein [Crocinitomicaceae bacterium]
MYPGPNRFTLDQFGIGVVQVIAGADQSLPAILGAKVGRHPVLMRRLVDLVCIPDAIVGDQIVINPDQEVHPNRLTFNNTPRLDRGFLRVRLPLDRDPFVQRPAFRQTGPRPQDIWKQLFQRVVAFELGLDLFEKAFGNRSGVTENPDSDFAPVIARFRVLPVTGKDIKDRHPIRDDRRLVVVTSPEIEMAVRVCLHLAAAIKQPGLVDILTTAGNHQQEEQIVAAEPALRQSQVVRRLRRGFGQLLFIEPDRGLAFERQDRRQISR